MPMYDTFTTYQINSVPAKVITNNVAVYEVLGGSTLKVQPLDTSLNKLFKGMIEKVLHSQNAILLRPPRPCHTLSHFSPTQLSPVSFKSAKANHKIPQPSVKDSLSWLN